jgi:hypothetical protein
MWHLATLASILGLLLAVMAVVTAGAMAAPIFTGERPRDAITLAFICVPVLQAVVVIFATTREDERPAMALKLYLLAVVLLAAQLALPALADLCR